MKLIMKIIFLAIFLISLTSCLSKSGSDELSKLPNWYVKPAQNDLHKIYGIGEGFTMQEASRAALNDMASRLAVSISSTSTRLSEENRYDYSDQFSQKIKEQIQEIKFNNYEIINSHQDDIKFYAEAAVDRTSFISDQKTILSQNHQEMANIYQKSQNENILIRLKELSKINEIAKKSSLINEILKGLDANRNFQKNLDKYQSYQDKYQDNMAKIEFLVKSDSIRMEDVITESLNSKNFRVVESRKNSKNLVLVEIKHSNKNREIYGSNISNVKINFKLKSITGKILASNIVEVSGHSVSSYEMSFESAIKKLKKKIKEEGILTIFGVKL